MESPIRVKRTPVLLAAAVWLVMGMQPAKAQSASPGGLTLEEAIALAVEKNPVLSASRQDRIAADEEKRLARAAWLPRLDVSETVMRTNNPVSAFGTLLNQANFTSGDFDVGRLNHPDAVNNFRSAITLTQPVYNGSREFLGLRLADIGREAAERNEENARQQLVFSVTRAYFNLVLAKENLSLAAEAVSIAEADLGQIRSRFKEGLAVKSDVLRAEVHLAGVREEKINAENRVRIARAGLMQAIGVDESVEVSGVLETIPSEMPDLDSLKESAQKSRPDFQALKNELDRSAVGLRQARSGLMPNLNLQGSYEFNNRTLTTDGSDSYTVLAVLNFNLFNGGSDRSRIQKAKAVRQKVGLLVEDRRRKIDLEVTEAYLDLSASRDRIGVREESVAQADENLRIVRNRYQNGMATILDLLTAEHLLSESKNARIRALYDYRLAWAKLNLAAGREIGPAAAEGRP